MARTREITAFLKNMRISWIGERISAQGKRSVVAQCAVDDVARPGYVDMYDCELDKNVTVRQGDTVDGCLRIRAYNDQLFFTLLSIAMAQAKEKQEFAKK